MVTLVTGDLFDSDAQTLVNAVNCAGVMGKGIALAFKRRFPAMFADYAARCQRGEVRLGEPYLYRGAALPWILNFPTKNKNHWRAASRLEGIASRAWAISKRTTAHGALPHWLFRRWAVALVSFRGMSLASCCLMRSAGLISPSNSTHPLDNPNLSSAPPVPPKSLLRLSSFWRGHLSYLAPSSR